MLKGPKNQQDKLNTPLIFQNAFQQTNTEHGAEYAKVLVSHQPISGRCPKTAS